MTITVTVARIVESQRGQPQYWVFTILHIHKGRARANFSKLKKYLYFFRGQIASSSYPLVVTLNDSRK